MVWRLPPQLFWLERSLYIHEHSNRFYSPAAYFITKVGHHTPTVLYRHPLAWLTHLSACLPACL